METITENGESLDVSVEQANALVERDVIYRCADCCGMFHLTPGRKWTDVESVAK